MWDLMKGCFMASWTNTSLRSTLLCHSFLKCSTVQCSVMPSSLYLICVSPRCTVVLAHRISDYVSYCWHAEDLSFSAALHTQQPIEPFALSHIHHIPCKKYRDVIRDVKKYNSMWWALSMIYDAHLRTWLSDWLSSSLASSCTPL